MRPRAVVTGAGVRIGRAIALELATRGFDVCVHYSRSAEPADETVAVCRAAGADAWATPADLGTLAGCRSLVSAVQARWDRLHVLVNNASTFGPLPFEQIGPDAWQDMLAVNLRAPFLLSQGLLSELRTAEASDLGGPEGQGGVVVHLCDIGAERPVSGYAHYSVSKAGLVMLVKAMAVELAPRVRTLGVSPGQVLWPDWYDEERRGRLERRIPMKRAGSAEDVARLVRFLVTEAHYLNGDIIPVDGGLSCRY
jgi:pteridine reductase